MPFDPPVTIVTLSLYRNDALCAHPSDAIIYYQQQKSDNLFKLSQDCQVPNFCMKVSHFLSH